MRTYIHVLKFDKGFAEFMKDLLSFAEFLKGFAIIRQIFEGICYHLPKDLACVESIDSYCMSKGWPRRKRHINSCSSSDEL